VLERFSGASAAYSLYDLGNRRGTVVETEATYSNPAVRLRRDSDNIHKSFPAGAFTQMQNWVNEDVTLVDATTNNGGFETAGAGGADVFADWDELAQGTSTVNQDLVEFDTGSASCRFDIDSSNSIAQVRIVDGAKDGQTIEYSIRAKTSVAGKILQIGGNNLGDYNSHVLTTDWETYSGTATIANGSTVFIIKRNSGASSSIWIDSVEATITQANAYATTWYDQSGVGVIANTYTSDFSAGVDGWGDSGATLAGNVDGIGGRDNCLSITADASTALVRIFQSITTASEPYNWTADVYIPSTNSDFTEIGFLDSSNSIIGTSATATDSWVQISLTRTAQDSFVRIGNPSVNDAGGDDVIYIRNIKVEQLNKLHNDATQTTADSQPKVVTAGTLVSDANGNYAPFGDGVDDYWDFSQAISLAGEFSVFGVFDLSTNSNAEILGKTATSTSRVRIDTSTNLEVMDESANEVNLATDTSWATGTVYSWSMFRNSSDSVSYSIDDTVQAATGTLPDGVLWERLLARNSALSPFHGHFSAILIYPTDQSANRSAIEQSLSNTITTALS